MLAALNITIFSGSWGGGAARTRNPEGHGRVPNQTVLPAMGRRTVPPCRVGLSGFVTVMVLFRFCDSYGGQRLNTLISMLKWGSNQANTARQGDPNSHGYRRMGPGLKAQMFAEELSGFQLKKIHSKKRLVVTSSLGARPLPSPHTPLLSMG